MPILVILRKVVYSKPVDKTTSETKMSNTGKIKKAGKNLSEINISRKNTGLPAASEIQGYPPCPGYRFLPLPVIFSHSISKNSRFVTDKNRIP